MNLGYRINVLIVFLFFGLSSCDAQEDTTKVVLITLDGLRWQELFSGADPLLVANDTYVKDTTGLKKHFWRDSPIERREVLFPFIWKEVSKIGQIHGNREKGSKVNLVNTMWFSYPGYNEILSGFADDTRIDSNEKINNPNVTVLEIANRDGRYKDKVAAFGSWDVFPYIVNEERSGVPVNAGFECPDGNSTFSLHQTDNLPNGEGIYVYFECEDLDNYVNDLKAKGIEFDLEPIDQNWLWREARLKDVDGNQLVLFYGGENRLNPPWRIKEETF